MKNISKIQNYELDSEIKSVLCDFDIDSEELPDSSYLICSEIISRKNTFNSPTVNGFYK